MAAKQRYDQLCPVATVLDVVGNRWALLVLRELLLGPRRFKDILAGLDGASTDMVTSRLRELETVGLVVRGDDRRYERTNLADMLMPVVREMLVFSLRSGLFVEGIPGGGERSAGPDPLRRVLGMAGVILATANHDPEPGTFLLDVDQDHQVVIGSAAGSYSLRAMESEEHVDFDGVVTVSPESMLSLLFGGVSPNALDTPIRTNNRRAKAVAAHLTGSVSAVWDDVRVTTSS